MKKSQMLDSDPALKNHIDKLTAQDADYHQRRTEYKEALALEPKLVDEIEKRQATCKLGDMEEAREILLLKEALYNTRVRATALTPNPGDDMGIWRQRWEQALPLVRKLGYQVLDRIRVDFKAKLEPVVGDEDASKLTELITPVQLLGTLLREGFVVRGQQDSYREAGVRMVQFVQAAQSEGFDPYKWRRDAHHLIEFLPTKPVSEIDQSISNVRQWSVGV
jgi:hypothetical protein